MSNAQSIALADASNQVSSALTNLSVSDNNVWNMLAIGGDRQQDDVITQLGIVLDRSEAIAIWEGARGAYGSVRFLDREREV